MPIDFFCPGCGNLMRTPNETAGRKGRCPTCQLKVQIPASTVASTSSEPFVQRTARVAKPLEPIRFDCNRCGKTLSIAAANAGKKGKCPHCGELMSIPTESASSGARWKGTPKVQPKSAPSRSSAPAPARQPQPAAATGKKIEFPCSNCHEIVGVAIAAAGKKGRCPRCQAVIQIPLQSTSASALRPIASDRPTTPSPRRQGNPTPATPGLTPLQDNSPAVSGLTPLGAGPASPLEPLGPGDDLSDIDPFGLVEVDDGNPFGNALNPYSAPRPIPTRPAKSSKGAQTGAELATKICGGCLILYAVGQLVIVALSLVFQSTATFAVLNRMREQGENEAFATGYVAGQVIAVVLSGVVMLTILMGGIQMIRLKVWGLCLAACILTMAPCNCFCLLGLPIGIWGTVMLSLGPVRAAFR